MSVSDISFNRIAWLCSRREYCSSGVRDLLRRKGVSGEEAEEILRRLCSERYVDDGRYARCFARDKALLAGWGSRKIAYALSSKGISPDIIQKALGDVDNEESLGRMREVIQVKWKTVRASAPQERRLKVLRFAVSRGYDYTAVLKELDSMECDET